MGVIEPTAMALSLSIEALKPYLGEEYELQGLTGITFSRVKPIAEADQDSLTWVSPTRADREVLVAETLAAIVVCDLQTDYTSQNSGKLLIRVRHPRLTFARIVAGLFSDSPTFGVDPSARIHPEAQIHPRSRIGPYCVVGRCIVSEGTVLVGNCHIYDNVRLGRNVVLQAGVVVGADGFGWVRNESGTFEKFPHIGGVVIGDEVEVGANSCIDRGALGDTVVGRGTKIGALVNIGHNVEIGENVLVTGTAVISGGTRIGNDAYVAPNATISNHLTIGSQTTVGLGAVVSCDVPDRAKISGRPAQILPPQFWHEA